MSERRECVVCGHEGPYGPLYERNGYCLVRCPSCRLVFEDPQPSDDVLRGSYYYDAEFSRLLQGDLRTWTLDRARHKLQLLDRVIEPKKRGRTLDVGCSSGAWLEVAATAGWRSTGIEPGADTAAAARGRGLDVRPGTFAEALPSLSGERFDLVTFWDVLEHLRDPREELALAHDVLAPGGFLAATFPNVEGWYPKLTYRLFARRTGVWEYPEMPVHLYDFSPATASRLFANSGFDVVSVRTFPTPFSFYRSTTLSPDWLGRNRRGRMIRIAYELSRLMIYPPARLLDRSNSMMIVARRPLART